MPLAVAVGTQSGLILCIAIQGLKATQARVEEVFHVQPFLAELEPSTDLVILQAS